jgi:hypothetical protein
MEEIWNYTPYTEFYKLFLWEIGNKNVIKVKKGLQIPTTSAIMASTR